MNIMEQSLVACVTTLFVACHRSEPPAPPPPVDMIKIPAGSFFGRARQCDSRGVWHPLPEAEVLRHRQWLPEFVIDRDVVHCAAFRRCVEAGACIEVGADKCDEHLAVISLETAAAFCTWRGARLASYAEWQRAARGTDGRRFPTGDHWSDEERCQRLTRRSGSLGCLFETSERFRYRVESMQNEWTGDTDCAVVGDENYSPDHRALPVTVSLSSEQLDQVYLASSHDYGEFRCAISSVDLMLYPYATAANRGR